MPRCADGDGAGDGDGAVRSPGLLGRSILASVLVAAVASVATAVLTADAVRSSAEREQVRVADVDRTIVDRLEAFGRGGPEWAGAGALLGELAASSERLIVVTNVDGAPLASSAGSDPGQREVGTQDPTAVLDPLAGILAAATAAVPAAYDELALPAPLLAARAGGGDLRAALRRDYDLTGICLDVEADEGPSGGVPGDVTVLTSCRDLASTRAGAGRGGLADLARLQSAVALEEYRCLQRRGVTSQLTRLFGADGSGAPDLLTVHVPGAADGARTSSVSRAWNDCATAVLTRHLRASVAPSAVLYVSETRAVERGLVDRVGGRRIVLALVVILVVAVVASLVASRRVLRPVRRLTEATQQMAAGELATRVPVTGHDEVARLGRSFNEMAQALGEADDQRRRMVSDVAHELRTPLSNLRGYLEAGHDGVLERDDAWTGSLLEEVALLQHVVDDLGVLAQADAGRLALHPVDGDVAATVDTALLAMRGAAESRSVTLARTGLASAPAPHDPLRLRQVVANLVSNAVRHSPEGATVTVDLRADAGPDDRPGVVVEVADRGAGIAAKHLPHVFERFFRADPSRTRETGGSGLGLAIVEQLVGAHGGAVTAGQRAGGGAVFTVWLPAGRSQD
nr:ATP-binding protein [Nocardioides soli]